ncbi:hypothetical protein VTN00DRAFT_2786 [Thermoascus crustaceus]|uniref:uncharacterized protein n=1 Tax=Thermoascus crustaceus TaxID=5088 RepID=UPI0037442429
MVSYVLRKGEGGFPPRNFTILKTMRSKPTPEAEAQMLSPKSKPDLSGGARTERVNDIWFRAIAVGILQATFEIYNDRISEWMPLPSNPTRLNEIARTSHRAMVPSQGNRSQQHRNFCDIVTTRAVNIANICVSDETFHTCFRRHGAVRGTFRVNLPLNAEALLAVSKLETTLKCFHRECPNDPVLIVVSTKSLASWTRLAEVDSLSL